MRCKHLKFGAFIAPHFPSDEHPSLAMEEDMDRVVLMEKLGFDEAWIGEHHSSGWEINGSPELFAAAVSQRTSRIKLGMGVVSLPYHNPWHGARLAALRCLHDRRAGGGIARPDGRGDRPHRAPAERRGRDPEIQLVQPAGSPAPARCL